MTPSLVVAAGPDESRLSLALALLCIPAWLRDGHSKRHDAERLVRLWGAIGAHAIAVAYRPVLP